MSRRQIVMRSTNGQRIRDFIDYANDSEGMEFRLSMVGASWCADTDKDYGQQVIAAVKRSFNQEYGDL